MKLKYRSRLEIISSILEGLSTGPAVKTRIMYFARINYTQLTEYIELLERNEIISNSGDKYRLLPKGWSMLSSIKEINQNLGGLPS